MKPWLSIVGIGDDGLAGLAPASRALVETAEIIVGGARHLAMIPPGAAERLPWRQPFDGSIAAISAHRGRRVVVLASGDPMWYGAGAILARHFPREEMTILPHPGAFSLTAARLGWPLAECTPFSLHARPLDTLRLHLAEGRRVLILAADGATPAAVARLLSEAGWGPSRLTALEHLGGPAEAVHGATAADWGDRRVADLNAIALECRAAPGTRGRSRLAGLPDDAFQHDGQLTKREIRAATLAALAPLPGERLWDVGAGCGSIAIEWLRADTALSAVAIERDAARAALIARNAAALGVPGLNVIHGTAPAALAGSSPPDAIFAGGGLADPALLPVLWRALRPGGRLVANVISTEGERALLDWQARHGGSLTRLAVSRAEPLAAHQIWRPLAVVTQLAVVKPG
ncbi:MAG TPA: precorrin-6y C5,15-methyltransferase (decarboxylating) subunit CbiE [Stellaceae bacterium]|nr:precorrin-6y C5,15-methyltransferase (decarboxylating) subunit CbiE [Stellaceae bacterium]